MKQEAKNTGGSPMLRRLKAEKKKAAIATLLIAIMAIMWIRLLTKKSDAGSGAMLAVQAATAQETQPKSKFTFIELPHVKGRNDILTRDIFAASKWEGLGAQANGERTSAQKPRSDHEQLDYTIEMIGKELKLEAIFSGKNPQASVCGTLVAPGGGLVVKHEGEKHEFKVVTISENEVVLECKGVRVKLSMARPTDSAN
jgi:hypothetical protein